MDNDENRQPSLQPIRLGALGVDLPPEWVEKGLIHQIIPSPIEPSKVYANIIVDESLIPHDPMEFLTDMYADLPDGEEKNEFVKKMRDTASEMLMRTRTTMESMEFDNYAVDEETIAHEKRDDGLFQMDCLCASGTPDKAPEKTYLHKKSLYYGGPLQFCVSTVAKQTDWEKRYPLFDTIHKTFRLMINGDDDRLDYQVPDEPEEELKPTADEELPGVVG